MNYLTLLVGAYLAFSNSHNTSVQVDPDEWNAYKSIHGKSYENEDVESMRKYIYGQNKLKIEEFNAKQSEDEGFELGINHLTDISDVEMKMMKGFRLPQDHHLKVHNDLQGEEFLHSILNDTSIEVPDSVDWRKVPGRVSRVKNQGMCGSCWAFASTGALEGQEMPRKSYLLRQSANKSMVELSEQNLVDCDKTDNGCSGGYMKDAFDFVKSEGGIEDEKSYPYVARGRKCKFRKELIVFSDSGAVILPEGNEEHLKQVVAKFGPVAVAIDANGKFQWYRKGIYYNKHCGSSMTSLDHAVLVVGYGTDPKGGDYWIVKNSWGSHFGQNGYILMARNKKNNCGIATIPTIPTF